MTIRLSDPQPEPIPSLACRLELSGRIRWRELSACKLTYADDEPELIEVCRVKKRNLHVISDQMLRAQASMDELPEHLSGLRLSSFPV